MPLRRILPVPLLLFAALALAATPTPPETCAGIFIAPAAANSIATGPDTTITLESPARGDTTAQADSAAAPDSVRGRRVFPRPDRRLVSKLQEGGYVIVFRHSITDWQQRDAELENFEDRATQRNLNKPGEEQAAAIGKSITALGIPVGRVLASPMWRCRDTAQLAFGRHETTPDLFRRGGPFREARVRMLSTPTEKGTNLVLVTHQDVLIPIIAGLRRDQLHEGEALIVRPSGDRKFEVLAQVSLEEWQRLAAEATQHLGAKSAK